MDREAAAVLVTRGEAAQLEVFLVERSPELRFFGGYWALPGGVREPAESLRQCAQRELREETNVTLRPDEPDLRSICRIRTPAFAPVRYDTEFFLATLPAEQVPAVPPGELVRGQFWQPAEALRAWRQGELLLVPPVILLLQQLVDGDLDRFRTAARELAAGYAAGKLHRVQFSPGVILASLTTPTLPPATTTNCLIVGQQHLWIIDPATPDPVEQARLFELLDELTAEGRTLAGVLLTHHHPDHTGAASAVSRRYALAVRAHALTLARLALPNPGAPLHDGDRLPLGNAPDGTPGWELEALFTPGHDRGHLCFRESRYRALIAGDMMSTVSTIVIDPPEGHMQTYLRSLERLAREPIGTLYPAHGPAARDGNALARHFLAHRQQRQQRLVEALRAGLTTIEALLPVVYADVPVKMHPVAARSLRAGLQLLVERGEAREVGGTWQPSGSGPAQT